MRLKKERDDAAIKDIRNLFRLKKENEAIKCRVITDIRNLFEHDEKEDYYIEYESNGHRNKALLIEIYLNEIRPYLKGIINNLKKSAT